MNMHAQTITGQLEHALATEAPASGGASRDVISRCSHNPLISLDDIPFRCSDIWNAGVIRFGGQYLLLMTVEMLEGRCAIFQARSDDGVNFTVEAEPFMTPDDDGPGKIYENVGVRDPRIIASGDEYLITYLADSDHGQRLGLARTKDFRSVEKIRYISQVDVKNGVLFPRKVGGEYLLLSRPAQGASIWLNRSSDLEFWRSESVVMTPRSGFWDTHLIGAAGPPIEIDAGWLLIYYGERLTSAGPLVRLGAAILDRDNPAKVIARSSIPILAPRERYERIGDVPNVVFSCGAVLDDDMVVIYYGASDSCICRGQAPLTQIVQTCFQEEA